MNKKLNKLVTNYPVELNEEEIENLSATLAPVIAACGGGGGTGGKIYTGTGFVNVNNTTNQIGLTEDANDKLNKEYVEYNEYSTAIANRYTKTQTNALLNEKQDTLEFEYDEDNKVSAINGSALAGQGGGDVNYSAGIDLKIENNIISVDTNGNPNNTASNTRNFVEGSWTVASGYNSHAEGMATTAYGYAVHAQGMWTKFSSSKWSDDQHPTPVDIYWAPGAGATVEGYCNATTSCPMSGTEGQSDYGPVHGGVLKVIGNGNVVHNLEPDPDAHVHTLNPSDALVIFKDGTISAFGDIYNNGKKYVTEDSISSYNVTAQAGVEVSTAHDTTTNTTTFGISVTSTPVVTDTKLSGYNGIEAELDGDVSGLWNVGLTQDMLNTINGKLDSTVATQTYLEKSTYASDSATFLTKTSADNDYASKTITATVNNLTGASAKWENASDAIATNSANWNAKVDQSDLDDYATLEQLENVSGKLLTTAQYQTDSATFALKTQLDDYYKKTDTSSKTELSTEFAKYVTTSTLETVSSTLNDDIEYVSGQVDNKVNKPTALTNKYLVLRTDSNGDVSGWCDFQEQSYSKSEAQGTFVHRDMLDNDTGGTLIGTGLTGGTVLGVNTDVIQTKLTDEQLSAIGEVSSKLDRADLDDYVPYSATKLVIGSNNDISVNNSDNTFAQGTNNKVSTSPYTFVQGEANSAVNYYNLAQGYGNYAQDHSLAQGSNNTAISVSFAQGQNCTAESYTFTQGTNNSAVTTSFAQGSANKARYDSFAQGNRNSAFSQSLAQGHYNSADDGSLAQGKHNTAYSHSFAQGSMNYADNNALAQGGDNTAKYFSQALGFGLSIQGSRGTTDGTDYISGGLAIGTYNQTSAGVAFVVGNGHSNGAGVEPTRSDAFLIYPDGRVSAKGDISANGVKLGAGGGSLTLPVNVGTGNDVSQTSAIGAIGNNCSAGTKSFAFSYKGATAYENSFVVNDDNIAGHNSFAWGWGSTADVYSMAGGNNVSAYNHSFVLAQGDSTDKSLANNYSIAFGNAVSADRWSYVFGRGLNFSGSDDATTGIGALVVGGWNNTTADALFVLGNGKGNSNRSDAFVVYRNGAVNAGYANTNTVNGSYSFIEGRDNHDVGTAGCNHIEGGYNSLSGLYSHAEGNLNVLSADHSHIEGYRNEFNTTTYDWGIHIGGMLNATTAQTNDHGGILRLIGNGTRQKSGNVETITRSDAYILYRDGTVKAKDFIAGGNTLSANYPVPKTIPNTADNTLKVQRMFVCTSDNDIIAHLNAGLAEGEGCVFFRVGN